MCVWDMNTFKSVWLEGFIKKKVWERISFPRMIYFWHETQALNGRTSVLITVTEKYFYEKKTRVIKYL